MGAPTVRSLTSRPARPGERVVPMTMDANTIFIIAVVVITFAVAFGLYSRRRDRRLVSTHRSQGRGTPAGAEGHAEVDHDRGEHAPVQHGTR